MNTSSCFLLLAIAVVPAAHAAGWAAPVTADPVIVEAPPLAASPASDDGLPAVRALPTVALPQPGALAPQRTIPGIVDVGYEAPGRTSAVAGDGTASPDGLTHMSEMVLQALSLLGTPYRWGGNSADGGFDCSGLVRHVVEQALGLVLPRSAIAMSRLGLAVERPALQPGDLLFFVTRRQDISHVGIYVGEGRFVHANRSGGAVTLASLESKYWKSRLVAARRVDSQ